MTRETKPVIKRFALLLLSLALVLTLADSPAGAQEIRPSSIFAPPVTLQAKPLRLSQNTFTPNTGTVTPGSRQPPPPGSGKPPPNRGKRPPGGGITIGIDIGKLFPPPVVQRPTYPPPKKVYHPPVKKVYVPPRKKPTSTARRLPPRRTVIPAAVQRIPQFIADQVTVLLRNQPAAVDEELARSYGLTQLSSTQIALLDGRLVTYHVRQGRPLPPLIARLNADTRVELSQPNNFYLTVQQQSRSSGASMQYAFAKLGLGTAHRIAQGRGVPVAVIDTGVDAKHPALANTIGKTYDAVADGKPDVLDHGTAIAGLIAGHGKVTGVAPAAALLAVRAFYMHAEYKRPVTSTDVLIRAFDWAYANKARIFNMSFAGPFDPLVQQTLAAAHDKGVILVAAAGNGGPKAPPAFPAAYKNVIAITALDHKDRLYAHANQGGYLAAAAPGVDVFVPTLKNGYRYSSGTSMAAAQVSGLIALLLEKNPEASAETVLATIKKTAYDLGPKGPDPQFGAGRADAYASLLSIPSGRVKLSSEQ